VHYEDQLASEKKCGHLGGKVLVPTDQFVRTLTSARLAADVMGVPTLVVARTDALAATLLTTDIDPRDQRFTTGERSHEGFHYVANGIDAAVARAQAYAPYADLLWCETSKPDLKQAERFAKAIHEKFPGKLLSYNCSPSFNWKANLPEARLRDFREQLAAMGYKYQFITLAGWHALNLSMFELASAYRQNGMFAYSELQQREFANEPNGFRAAKHQAFVGTGYFDALQTVISGGSTSTTAMAGSTEEDQFKSAASSH
jgi:isocitrate lyase